MEKEDIKKIEEELSESLKESSEIAKARLEQGRNVIDQQTRNQIENYSNDIRNISIISGTIAPFSLTLLSIERLNLNTYFLVSGFILLLLNIALAQFFIRSYSSKKDTQLVRAEFHWIMAESEMKKMTDDSIQPHERVGKGFDYLKSISESEKFLGISTFNIEIQTVRAVLKKYYKVTNTIFSLGTAAIILSVVVNPICSWIMMLLEYVSKFLC